jgi:hypothetical protein
MSGVVDVFVVQASNAREDLVDGGGKEFWFSECLDTIGFIVPVWKGILIRPDVHRHPWLSRPMSDN